MMLTLCSGLMRSGSTWSYNVCKRLAEHAREGNTRRGEGEALLGTYLPPSKLDALLEADDPPGAVIKCHNPGPRALSWIERGQIHNIYTYRDPRDCVVSLQRFRGWSFDESLHEVASLMHYYDIHVQGGETLFLRYEDFMLDATSSIRRVARKMGLACDDLLARGVAQATGWAASRATTRRLRAGARGDFGHDGSHRVDADTLLHHNHLGNGSTGQWRDSLTQRQRAAVEVKLRPWIAALGYSLSGP